MIENNLTGVAAAFEMLLEEIEAEINLVNQAGARALEDRDYDKAKEAIERAERLTAFRNKAEDLRREWENLFAPKGDDMASWVAPRGLSRLRRGQRTREEAYYQPILAGLQALGGSAPMNQVLEIVYQAMQSTLKEADLKPLASDPNTPRWKNTAQWARHRMVKKGLLRNDSPRGIWQITEAGIRFLQGKSNG